MSRLLMQRNMGQKYLLIIMDKATASCLCLRHNLAGGSPSFHRHESSTCCTARGASGLGQCEKCSLKRGSRRVVEMYTLLFWGAYQNRWRLVRRRALIAWKAQGG